MNKLLIAVLLSLVFSSSSAAESLREPWRRISLLSPTSGTEMALAVSGSAGLTVYAVYSLKNTSELSQKNYLSNQDISRLKNQRWLSIVWGVGQSALGVVALLAAMDPNEEINAPLWYSCSVINFFGTGLWIWNGKKADHIVSNTKYDTYDKW